MVMQTLTPDQKATQIRIDRALAQPGAKGKRGFLLWVNAAFPKKVADAVALAAAKHIPPGGFAGFGYLPRTRWKSPSTFGMLGDDSGLVSVGVDSVDLTPSTTQAVADATDSSPPSSSWVSDIANAFSSVVPALSSAYQVKQQASAAQTLFNTNLQLAMANKPLISGNPTAYTTGFTPGLNIGLSSSTQSALLWVAGGLGVIALLSVAMKGNKSSH